MTSLDDAVLAGWAEVTPAFLALNKATLGAADLRQFFDGGQPDWRHALADEHEVPRRQVAANAAARLRNPSSQTMVLLVGSGGEGRSTTLRQVAFDLTQSGGEGRRVLFREPGVALDVDAVAALAAGPSWILISDDADEIARDVEKAVQRVAKDGRRDIHWLLSARDADWKAQFQQGGRSLEPPWKQSVELWPDTGAGARVMALSADDATKVVAAWTAAGCLGLLGDLPPDERVAALLEAAGDRAWLSDGTFFGGLVERRFGPEGLTAHVQATLEAATTTVREAFLYVAAAHAAGVDGVDLNVVADLIGVDRANRRDILVGLGRAGLATGSGGAIRVRHESMAGAALRLVEGGRFGLDLETIFRRLVRGTGVTGTDLRGLVAGAAIMNCGPTLSGRLQTLGIAAPRANRIACTVADAAADVLGNLLVYTVYRAQAYREAGAAGEATAILRAAVADSAKMDDWEHSGRRFLYELGVSESDAGHPVETILLAGLSLADGEGLGLVSMTETKLAFLAIAAATSQMDEHELDIAFQRLFRISAQLGPKIAPKWDQRARLSFHTHGLTADNFDVPECSQAQGLHWLADALAVARGLVRDPDLAALWAQVLPDPRRPDFTRLNKTLGFGNDPFHLRSK